MPVKAAVNLSAAASLVGETRADKGDSYASSSDGAVERDSYVIFSLGSLLSRIPLQRIAVWAAVALTLYQLRDFVGVRNIFHNVHCIHFYSRNPVAVVNDVRRSVQAVPF